MKKILYFILSLACVGMTTSCSEEEWSNGDPAMEHIYYIGFENWGTFKNDVTFNVNQGQTVEVPMQFYSEFVRDYDAVTYYYVVSDLQRGVDYDIVNESGASVQPDGNGAYQLVWPKAQKGVKNVYVKALNGNKGNLTLQTFNPNAGVTLSNQDVESTIQHTESQYEVRIFTQNYKVKVTIK